MRRFVWSDDVLDGCRLSRRRRALSATPSSPSRWSWRWGSASAGWASDAAASGARVAVDLALAWSFVCAAIVGARAVAAGGGHEDAPRRLGVRAPGSRPRVGALRHALDAWPPAGEAVWVALLVHVVLTFATGRAWSRRACGRRRRGGYVVALGGPAGRVSLVDPDRRDVFSPRGERAVRGHAVGRVAGNRGGRGAPGSRWARRAAPSCAGAFDATVRRRLLLVAAVTCRSATGARPGSASGRPRAATRLLGLGRRSHVRAALLLPSGVARRCGLDEVAPLGRVGARRRASDRRESASLRDRLARALGDPTLELAYRLDDGRYVDSSGDADRAPGHCRIEPITPLTARGDGDRCARARSGAAGRARARRSRFARRPELVLENERLAAEVRVPARQRYGHRGAGSSLRPMPSGGASSVISTTVRSSVSSRCPSRSGSQRPRGEAGDVGRALTGTGRDRGGDRRAP